MSVNVNDIDRDAVLEVLSKHVTGETLLRHSVTVEAAMRHLAVRYGGDPEEWGAVGLLHDVDFEKYPEEHCSHVRGLLEGEGLPEAWLRAIESHGFGIVTDVRPETDMEKALYAVDELTGLVAATAIMRPSKSVLDLEVKSVMKKWKTPAFAAGCDREVIAQGAEMLGLEVNELVGETIAGMRAAADAIGLAGNPVGA